MADPIVSITYSDQALRQQLQRIERQTRDLTPLMQRFGEALLLSTDERWEQEIAPTGVPWKPNTPYTIAQKRSQGRILKILQSTGRLRGSIAYRAERDRVVVGTNVSYAAKNQATRPFLGISESDRVNLQAEAQAYFSEISN